MSYEKELENQIERLTQGLEQSHEDFDYIKNGLADFIKSLQENMGSNNFDNDLSLIEECIRGCDDEEVFGAVSRVSNFIYEVSFALTEVKSVFGVDDTDDDERTGWAAVEDEIE